MSLRLEIRNYKSIRTADIDLKPGITILIGPNGSGKTCLLSALQFLRDVFRLGAAQALARQGGTRRVYHHGQSEMSFGFHQPYGERTFRRRKIPCTFCWQFTIAQAGLDRIATIVREKAVIAGRYGAQDVVLFSLDVDRTGEKPKVQSFLCPPSEFGHDLFSAWKMEHGSQRKSLIAENFYQKGFQRTLRRLHKDPDRSAFPLVAQLDQTLNDIYSNFMFLNEYNILPDVARASTEQLPYAEMAPNGEGVSEVIDALEHRRYHKLEQLRFMDLDDMAGANISQFRYHFFHPYMRVPFRLMRWNRGREPYEGALDNINRQLSAAVRPITAVSIEIDPTSGRRFVVFKAGMEKFYPEEVSDGTVKWLCILVSLFVPFSRVYLIEEPENFLHPWMQQRLIEIMREQAKQNGTIFLLSTHSATILNAALPEEILLVKQSNGGTILSAMGSIEDIRKVLAASDFHLGDLWVSGAIGGVPADE
jgi:predicted ATPase